MILEIESMYKFIGVSATQAIFVSTNEYTKPDVIEIDKEHWNKMDNPLHIWVRIKPCQANGLPIHKED